MKRNKSIESICISRIELGITSINNGHRDGEAVGTDLEFFFTKLSETNKEMYEELFARYCIARLDREKLKVSV